jgi:hypothetical protein
MTSLDYRLMSILSAFVAVVALVLVLSKTGNLTLNIFSRELGMFAMPRFLGKSGHMDLNGDN